MSKISIALNGGSKEMNSATIPVEWWLSEDVLKQDPCYLILFEQSERESSYYDRENRGRRYACKVSDVVYFLQLFSPGWHRLMVAVVNGGEKDGGCLVDEYLRKDAINSYKVSMPWTEYGYDDNDFLAVTIVEFYVPDKLFAKPPQTKLGKMMWRWVNLWFESKPKDQCEYRRRKWIAFTIQPPLVLIFSILSSLYVLVASAIVFFFGFRPRPLLEEVKDAFLVRKDDLEVRRYEDEGYKVWQREWDGTVIKRMPVAPWEIAFAAIAIYGLYLLSLSYPYTLIAIILTAVFSIIFLFALFYTLTKAKDGEIYNKVSRLIIGYKKNSKELEQKWIREQLSLDNKKDIVNLEDISAPPTLSRKITFKFRVGYWALKAKMCKPFSS